MSCWAPVLYVSMDLEKYMPSPNSDPHGGIEDFIEADKLNQCMPVPKSNKVKY